ncbi:SDR family oxidoreductase [Shewanella sp. NIFS-20-20]|uniref:SDR family oxidoreductase n=1 Tax=Shewanella sp. NIFS-20-20 TaxID=2853806 RepID=UPI001C44772C|nr:SDR family oxidoreductase [Shewanella sp. NIFS-20-20]MBV7315537.1 SDR family oxidoreductase [Shewanella sp. NIFS-20-20]
MKNNVAIIACGWLGQPLAHALQAQGWQIQGTRRSEAGVQQLQADGIEAVCLDLARPESLIHAAKAGLFSAEHIIINIPPGLRSGQSPADYLGQLQALKQAIITYGHGRVMFISTTGVYPNGVVDETTEPANDARAQVFVAAEQLFADLPKTCIVRLAGLVGPGRHPGRFFAGKTEVSGGDLAVNLVHLDDCIAGVSLLLQVSATGIYNLCAPEHLSKREFYQQAALALGKTAPTFIAEPQMAGADKRVNGHKICRQHGFRYQHARLIPMLANGSL